MTVNGHNANALERFPAPGWGTLLLWLGRACTSLEAAQVLSRFFFSSSSRKESCHTAQDQEALSQSYPIDPQPYMFSHVR